MAAYELKRKQTFQASWKEFPWVILKDVEESPSMFCEVCLKFPSTVEKAAHFLKELHLSESRCLSHDKSKQHLACMAAKRADNPSSGALPVITTNRKKLFIFGASEN